MNATYCVYILECCDGSFYTGSTSNLEKRMAQHHQAYFPECYTAARRPLSLIWHQFFDHAEEMVSAERQIKGWSRKKKSALIDGRLNRLPALSRTAK